MALREEGHEASVLHELIDLFLHLDKHLHEIIQQYGTGTYLVLVAIIFCETGLVFLPFLPGDSLLFAAGAFAATGSLNLWLLLVLLTLAAIVGDTANYWIGRLFGQKILENGRIRLVKPEHLARTHDFFERYGGKTIVIARFVPIVRTLAPFVAGLGRMSYGRFMTYNVTGGIGWVVICTLAGYFFGNLPFVKNNFSLVVLAIIFISILPGVFEYLRHRREKARPRERTGQGTATP